MNIIGKKQENKEQEKSKFHVPVIIKKDAKEIPLKKALLISLAAHPIVIIILLALLSLSFPMLNMPQPKTKDIEFVLVNKPEQKPVNPHTKYRADRNSRAGGKHDPNRPVSEPEPRRTPSQPQQPSISQQVQSLFKKTPVIHQNNISKQISQLRKQIQEQIPTPTPPRPVPKPSTSGHRAINKPNPITVPMPGLKAPKTPSRSRSESGPIGSSGPSSSPAPVMSSEGSSSSSSRGRRGSSYSLGGGNAGNPSPGNPSGSPGIDAAKEPDFGPYMRELQRRIKRNWTPPKESESKRVVLLFKIGRDGRLIPPVQVSRSSGSSENDRAAVSAVELTAPFRPLPPEFRGNDVDIQFTFDYNVFSVESRQY